MLFAAKTLRFINFRLLISVILQEMVLSPSRQVLLFGWARNAAKSLTRGLLLRKNTGSCWGILCISTVKMPEDLRSEEHTSELQSLMRISYAVFCLKKKK